MVVTLKKIASEVDVSVSLVSQVLNGKATQSRIKKETELLVTEKAKELGYVSNKIARALRTKKNNVIALLTPNLANPFFAKITKVVQNELNRYGYSLMILESSDETKKEIEEMKLVQSRGIDGMLIIPVGDEFEHIENLANENYPLVLLYRTFNNVEANSVTVSHYLNMNILVSSLIKSGHSRIGLLQGKDIRFANLERLRGYKDAFKENNIEFIDEYINKTGFEREDGYEGAKRLLELKLPPTALITTSDALTFGTLQVIKEKNLKIPDDIVFNATNCLYIDRSMFVPISTLSHPVEELGETAVRTLIDNIELNEQKRNVNIILKSNVNINKSK